MAKKSNMEILKYTFAIAAGSFFGWQIFSGFKELTPFFGELDPIVRIGIGLIAIFLMVKIGLREQG